MNRNTKIIVSVVVWAALAVYLVLAAGYCSRRSGDRVCTGLNITVKDSAKLGFLTKGVVRKMLVDEGMRLTGARIDSINLLAVEEVLTAQAYVKKARVYTSMDGKLNIEVEQREPVARVQTENGYRFYLSDDGYVLPMRHLFFVDVPVVTGVPQFPFGTDFAGKIPGLEEIEKKLHQNYHFLQNLINFVGFLKHDPFWGGQIVQINVIQRNEVELIPRVGRGVVLLGELGDYPEKLDKLFTFYKRGLAYEGWNKYATINLKYKNQVVCTK